MTDDAPLDDLVTLYVDQKLSLTQIARQIGCSVTRVRDGLLACGVTLRSRKEGMMLRHEVLGQHNKGKPRSAEVKAKIREAHQRRAD